ncbi:MAG: hypothetical protein OJF50_006635 [Nitrospira sp.]|jgi:single-stranded DNA-binding protein|nr:hypothetical protein [Nitrospira sp.]
MRDENYCTIGGRITHDPAIYNTQQQGQLLSFSIAHHSNYPDRNTAVFFEVKVSGASDRTKLAEFATRLSKGRKVTVHNAELQLKRWKPSDSDETKTSHHLFCRMDQIFLHEVPRVSSAQA